MKKLFLIRHAKAEDGGMLTRDFNRNLTDRGRNDAERKAQQLIGIQPTINHIISSDANRALQTAQIFAKQFNIPDNLIEKEHFIYNDYHPSDLLFLLQQQGNDVESFAVFGHNPNIAYAAASFVTQPISHFSTSCVAAIEFDVNDWNDITLKGGKLLYLLND